MLSPWMDRCLVSKTEDDYWPHVSEDIVIIFLSSLPHSCPLHHVRLAPLSRSFPPSPLFVSTMVVDLAWEEHGMMVVEYTLHICPSIMACVWWCWLQGWAYCVLGLFNLCFIQQVHKVDLS